VTDTASLSTDRELLAALYDAAVAGAEPTHVTERAVDALPIDRASRVWLFSFGKAATTMARGALASLLRERRNVAGGVVVGAEVAASPYGTLTAMRGEHPIPGPPSFAAAKRIGEVSRGRRGSDVAIVLVSGGTSSLIAAPIAGLGEEALTELFQLLLTSGLDIHAMNAVRKRFTRWGAGRLALALAPAATYCLAMSDVVGDDEATIGSGPCSPDKHSAQDILAILEKADLLERIAPSYREHLESASRGTAPETPKAGHPAFAHVVHRVIVDNRAALLAGAARATALGVATVEVATAPVTGEASEQGAAIARDLLAARSNNAGGTGEWCRFWGGETTVTLGSGAPLGGRCQELALSAARVLHEAGGAASGITLLAAGTDGRDGPTDAAGACVDATTWAAIAAAGVDPGVALAEHRAHAALDAAGALVRRAATGTNVMDVIVGYVSRRADNGHG
jgi:glycerate 2-kinase